MELHGIGVSRQTMLLLGLLTAALVTSSCGDDSSPTAPQVVSISGNWQYTESFSNSQLQVSCNASGTATIAQNGTNLTGTVSQVGSCNGPGGSIDNSGTGSITGGQVQGSSVSFDAGECHYTGTISGSPPNRLAGSQSCTVALSGQNYTFTGTWQASR